MLQLAQNVAPEKGHFQANAQPFPSNSFIHLQSTVSGISDLQFQFSLTSMKMCSFEFLSMPGTVPPSPGSVSKLCSAPSHWPSLPDVYYPAVGCGSSHSPSTYKVKISSIKPRIIQANTSQARLGPVGVFYRLHLYVEPPSCCPVLHLHNPARVSEPAMILRWCDVDVTANRSVVSQHSSTRNNRGNGSSWDRWGSHVHPMFSPKINQLRIFISLFLHVFI